MRKNKSKTLVFLSCVIVAVGALFINERYMKAKDIMIYNLIMTVAITLLTTAIFSFFSDLFRSNDVEKIASQNFSVLKYCQEYGLYGIYEKFPLEIEEIERDFINSKEIYIVMNDAKAFISSNMPLLEKRISSRSHSTNFILQDYNKNDIMSALTRKNGHMEDPDYYKNKIKNLIEYHMKDLNKKCNKNHTLSVYLNQNYNTLAMILTDNYAMMSIYRVAPGKTRVPHFVFVKGKTEYDDIHKDVLKIKELANKIELEETGGVRPCAQLRAYSPAGGNPVK